MGHIASVCCSKALKLNKSKHDNNNLRRLVISRTTNNHQMMLTAVKRILLHRLGEHSLDPITVPLQLNGKKLVMEVNTGATRHAPIMPAEFWAYLDDESIMLA